jgi:hypothetical protein
MGLALYRDKTLSVALPEIGQNLHELDWQSCRSFFNIIQLGAERRLTQTSFNPSRTVCLVSLSGPHFAKRMEARLAEQVMRTHQGRCKC